MRTRSKEIRGFMAGILAPPWRCEPDRSVTSESLQAEGSPPLRTGSVRLSPGLPVMRPDSQSLYDRNDARKSSRRSLDLHRKARPRESCRRKDLQIRQLFDLAVDGRTSEKIFERNKVDGSLTSSPGAESRSELSGAGRRADLYSDFGVQRNLRDLCFSKLVECFSGTGRRLNIGKNCVNCA
jgi:hypothetical protein